uniref:Uncharacterized protein n=1 Tax=Acrobeloides nanus TaxID=290746 RepID=A0A914CUX9_9BILA
MNYYFFDHAKYNRLYNCSMLNDTQWESYKQPSIFGAFHVILATIYQILYLPFLVVMLKEQFWKYSCYKMMFFLGVTDVCATIIGGTFEGIFAIKGDIFCTNPNFMYLVGCFQVEGVCYLVEFSEPLLLTEPLSEPVKNHRLGELYYLDPPLPL